MTMAEVTAMVIAYVALPKGSPVRDRMVQLVPELKNLAESYKESIDNPTNVINFPKKETK